MEWGGVVVAHSWDFQLDDESFTLLWKTDPHGFRFWSYADNYVVRNWRKEGVRGVDG